MKRNAALVVAFLCLLTFIMPWGAFVSDPFYIHTWAIFSSTLLVIACHLLSRSLWSFCVQTIEVACIVYQTQVIFGWDNQADPFYIYHDQFMLCALIFELLCISTSINKFAAVMDGITGYIGRTFLSFVRLYPAERRHINLPYDKERRQC
jgi:hypothetical protein